MNFMLSLDEKRYETLWFVWDFSGLTLRIYLDIAHQTEVREIVMNDNKLDKIPKIAAHIWTCMQDALFMQALQAFIDNPPAEKTLVAATVLCLSPRATAVWLEMHYRRGEIRLVLTC